MKKVDELNENVPMDVDRVVVVKDWDYMEIDNDPWGSTTICRILRRFIMIPWRSTRICIEND